MWRQVRLSEGRFLFVAFGFWQLVSAITFSKIWTSVVFYVHQFAHLLACLLCQESILLRTLNLGKAGLLVRWLIWKQPFLPFLIQPGPIFWPQKAQIRNSLNSILVKKDRYIIINFVTLRLTKVKFLKIISFLPFLTQIRQTFGTNTHQMQHFYAIFALNFHSDLCTATTFCFKRYSPSKIWQKPIDKACFFTFFTTLD